MELAELPNVELPRDSSPINTLPAEMFCMIMHMLQLWEQFSLRRVCHSWKKAIESLFNQEPKLSLKLNVTEYGEHVLNLQPHLWRPEISIRQMQFDFVYKGPAILFSKQAQITIRDRALNWDAAIAIGRMFPHIEELVIYWDTCDCEHNIDNLVMLLYQKFSSLTSFGLIVSGRMSNPTAMAEICFAIDMNMNRLEQLHLMMPTGYETTNQRKMGPTMFMHSEVKLERAIKSVTRFSMTGTTPNLFCILNKIGCNQLDTLTLPANLISAPNEFLNLDTAESVSQLMPKFVSVKRLQLSAVACRENVEPWIEFFPNVEQLHLTHSWLYATKKIHLEPLRRHVTFGYNWIRTLKRFTKLTELTLHNFKLEFMSHTVGRDDLFDGQVERFDQVRKLTFASSELFYHFQLAKSAPFFPGLMDHHLGHTIGIRFPGLRELNLWSGDGDLNETENPIWKKIEQSLNEQLPTVLPLMPGLRVNVQMRHPVMYSEYLSWPVEVRRGHRDQITQFYVNTMKICILVIFYVFADYDAEYLDRLLRGNIHSAQDGQAVERLRKIYERAVRAQETLDRMNE